MAPGDAMWGMPPGSRPQIDMDAQCKMRIRSFINTAVYNKYPDGVDENDLDAILLEFEKFLDECEQERVRQ